MRKLLNALRVRMGWLGYKFGPVSNPFEDRFCIAVKNPDGKSRIVFIDEITDFDLIALDLHVKPDVTEIKFGSTTKSTEEATNDD